MTRTWRTDPYGRVHVTDDGVEWLPFPTAAGQATCDHIAAHYGDMFRAEADGAGIFWVWLVAMAYRESGGNPRAQSRDGGSGLFQITDRGLRAGLSDEQLYDAQVNTRIAARYIADLRRRFGNDFPRVSAAFNAGSPRPDPSSPWNLHATGDHIIAEVEALNYVCTRGLPIVEGPPIAEPMPAGAHAGDDEPEEVA